MEVRIPSNMPGFGGVKDTSGVDDNDENFEIYSSSDEGEDGVKKEWEPSPQRIVELYTQIANGQLPELNWRCPGRREPSVEGDDEDDIEESQNLEEVPEQPTAFDFDSMFSEPSQPLGGQRKNPGTLKVQQKRVARLDKILSDMKKDTSTFQLQSPRVPYQASPRHDGLPGTNLFGMQAARPEATGIPLPSAYTLTSRPMETSPVNISGTDDDVAPADRTDPEPTPNVTAN